MSCDTFATQLQHTKHCTLFLPFLSPCSLSSKRYFQSSPPAITIRVWQTGVVYKMGKRTKKTYLRETSTRRKTFFFYRNYFSLLSAQAPAQRGVFSSCRGNRQPFLFAAIGPNKLLPFKGGADAGTSSKENYFRTLPEEVNGSSGPEPAVNREKKLCPRHF